MISLQPLNFLSLYPWLQPSINPFVSTIHAFSPTKIPRIYYTMKKAGLSGTAEEKISWMSQALKQSWGINKSFHFICHFFPLPICLIYSFFHATYIQIFRIVQREMIICFSLQQQQPAYTQIIINFMWTNTYINYLKSNRKIIAIEIYYLNRC